MQTEMAEGKSESLTGPSPGSNRERTRNASMLQCASILKPNVLRTLRITFIPLTSYSLFYRTLATSSKLNMPPKKRKASEDSDNEKGSSTRATKKTAPTEENTSPIAPNGQPTNKALPANIEIPEKTEGALRISSWNVSGLAASQKKVCYAYLLSLEH